jgi:putative PIN family toxin of toxin-antitoxin system
VSLALAVIDTNVMVSGLLTSRLGAPTARILDRMLEGRFPFLLSLELLAEYRAVLLRPKIRNRHRLQERDIEVILTEIAANARFREPEAVGRERARGDDHLWALLDLEPGCVLVTGDRLLSEGPRVRGRVLTPREYVRLLT